MKEFMLLIRNDINNQSSWTPEQHTEFLKKCEAYIAKLKKEKRLISAQPLVREGTIISKSDAGWMETAFNVSKEVQVGYYHVYARDLEEATEMAKGNPEFEYGKTARVEVRPIRMKEESTGFAYPRAR